MLTFGTTRVIFALLFNTTLRPLMIIMSCGCISNAYCVVIMVCICIYIAKPQSTRCFRRYPNCIIVNDEPFDRIPNVTLDVCQRTCLQYNQPVAPQPLPTPQLPLFCRSFVYIVREQICDIYDVTWKDTPVRLIQFPARDYYEPTGLCQSLGSTRSPPIPTTTPTTAGPALSNCAPGQVARFTKLDGFELESFDDIEMQGITEDQCAQFCSQGFTPPGGQPLMCRSFDYRRQEQTCILSSNTQPPEGTGAPREAAGSAFYSRFCVKAQGTQGCPLIIERQSFMILSGVADQVVSDINTLEECVAQCSGALIAGRPCLAGMFYVEFRECILSNKDSRTDPRLKEAAPSGDLVDLFELNCPLTPAGPAPGGRSRNNGVPVAGRVGNRDITASPATSTLPTIEKMFAIKINPLCPRGVCCPHQGSCDLGLIQLPNGTLQWCLNPCGI